MTTFSAESVKKTIDDTLATIDKIATIKRELNEQPKEIWAVDTDFMVKRGLDPRKAHGMIFQGEVVMVVHQDVIKKIRCEAIAWDPRLSGAMRQFHGLPIVTIHSPPKKW